MTSISHTHLPDASPLQTRIQTAYDPHLLAQCGHALSDLLESHMTRLQRGEGPVLPWQEPSEKVALAARELQWAVASANSSAQGASAASDLVARYRQLASLCLQHSQNVHHPRYIGHQVPASVPLAALFDAIGAATNQGMAIYEMGPWGTATERALIDLLGQRLGYAADTFAGICTHGASLANLTALLTARNVALPDAWKTGVCHSNGTPILVVHHDIHYCVNRSAGILGLGTTNIRKVPVDSLRRMDTNALEQILQSASRAGERVIAVVAAACTTPTGSFDDLAKVATICHKHKVWLHVDAAHGGGVLMSDRHRPLLAGIEQADSVVWDAHKMLFMPALSAFLFYKDKGHRFAAFQQEAPYLFDPTHPGMAEYDSGTQTVECTKRSAALALWGTWSMFGPQLFADLVDSTFAVTQSFYKKLSDAVDFIPLHRPQANIQVFRYQPPNDPTWEEDRQGDKQLQLRRAVIEAGDAYLVPIRLDGVGALRATIINPLTTEAHLDECLQAIRTAAKNR